MQIRFISDPTAEFARALDLSWDGGKALFGGPRSVRYALKVENGKVKETFIEPDDTGADGTFCAAFRAFSHALTHLLNSCLLAVSMAEKVLR